MEIVDVDQLPVALALSFLPVQPDNSKYTYHHLRRDLWNETVQKSGLLSCGRYVVPSAHVTIARFNSINVFPGDPDDESATLQDRNLRRWLQCIDVINTWLSDIDDPARIEAENNEFSWWTLGEEEGLELRIGRTWYGGGELLCKGLGRKSRNTATDQDGSTA